MRTTVRIDGDLAAKLRRIAREREMTADAHLAALAIEHGADLCSSDSDFSRFAGVSWRDPLA